MSLRWWEIGDWVLHCMSGSFRYAGGGWGEFVTLPDTPATPREKTLPYFRSFRYNYGHIRSYGTPTKILIYRVNEQKLRKNYFQLFYLVARFSFVWCINRKNWAHPPRPTWLERGWIPVSAFRL